MIALLASAMLGLYILIPDLLFRRITSWFTPLKKFQRTQTEEVVFGILVAALPVFAAWILSLTIPFMGHHPFVLNEENESRTADYRTLILAADSETYFKENASLVWTAADHVEKRQFRFLIWTYLMLLAEISAWCILTYNYASLRRFRAYELFANKVLLKRVSEWHILLTTYNFPKSEGRFVLVDALTTDEHLYQGRLADYFLDVDGNLSGILLKGTKRFKFLQYEEDRKEGNIKTPIDDHYWTLIPGANLYIPFEKIANLNIHYKLPKETEQKKLQDVVGSDALKGILAESGKKTVKIETRD